MLVSLVRNGAGGRGLLLLPGHRLPVPGVPAGIRQSRVPLLSGCGGMRLAELSAGYREAAGLLDIQISRLRRLRRGTADAQTRAVLANRLRKLCEARRQCRELALLCEHYYERGFYRYASDSFQGLAP